MTAAPDDRAARAARSGLAVVASVLVTLGAHLAGGGRAPAPLLVLAVVAIAWPAGLLLLVGRRPHLLRQVAVVGLAQGMLHAVFAAGGGAVAAGATVPTGMPGMHDPVLPASLPPMHHDGVMWWAHLLAGLLVVAAWRRGEAVLRHLLAPAVLRRVLALLASLPSLARSGAGPRARIRIAADAGQLGAHRDRGPPLPV